MKRVRWKTRGLVLLAAMASAGLVAAQSTAAEQASDWRSANDAVGQFKHLFQPVRDVDERAAFGTQPLDQPAALAAGAGSLWIANTGAHEVLRFDLASGKLGRLPIGE